MENLHRKEKCEVFLQRGWRWWAAELVDETGGVELLLNFAFGCESMFAENETKNESNNEMTEQYQQIDKIIVLIETTDSFAYSVH